MLMLKADWSREVKSTFKPPARSAVKNHLQKALLLTQLARSRACASQGLDAHHPLLLSGVPSQALQTQTAPWLLLMKGSNLANSWVFAPASRFMVSSPELPLFGSPLLFPAVPLDIHKNVGTWDLSWRGPLKALDLVLRYCK